MDTPAPCTAPRQPVSHLAPDTASALLRMAGGCLRLSELIRRAQSARKRTSHFPLPSRGCTLLRGLETANSATLSLLGSPLFPVFLRRREAALNVLSFSFVAYEFSLL